MLNNLERFFRTGQFTPRTWRGLPFELADKEAGHTIAGEVCMPQSMLWVLNRGCSPLQWFDSGRRRDCLIEGELAVFWKKEHVLADIRNARATSGFAVFFPEDRIERWLHDDAPKTVRAIAEMVPHQFRIDPFAVTCLRTIAAEIEHGCPSGASFAEAISISLITYLTSAWRGSDADNKGSKIQPVTVRRVREFIDANLSQNLSVTELATEVGLSARQLCRSFKLSLGVPVHQYVMRRRIERAKELLRHMDATEVAMATGFSSSSHLSTLFKKVTGITPSAYRERL